MENRTSDFYQFSKKPFEDNPDPKFLYLTASYQEISASILTWIKEGHGFAAITGEAGTGKTFLIHALISHLDEKINHILFPNPVITFRDLLKQILWALKQPTQEKTETVLFHQFIGFLDQMTAQDKTVLIILDEAQDLNDQTLEGIERFLDLKSKPIKIIFVGQPRFEERLNSMGFRRLGQKIEAKEKIRPFTEEESRGYIDHRLRLVGSSSGIITPKAISAICSYAQGIPSSINHVCDNALWVGCTMNCKKIDVDIIEKVIQNLEGPRITPKIFPSIQPIRQIWRSPIRFAISFKRVSTALVLKGIQNLGNLRIIPKTLSSIQPIRQIWRSSIRFATSFKRVSMALVLKVIQNLGDLRIPSKTLPSIHLIRQIWRAPIQFAISFKRVSMALVLKAKQNLEGPRIIPKTLPSIQPIRQIWRSSIRFATSFKRVSMALVLKAKQNLEGLRITPKILPSIQPIRQIWRAPIRFAISFKRGSMTIFLLVCLGGLIFLFYEDIGLGSMKVQGIKSFIGQKLATRLSTHKPSVQEKIKEILEKDRIPTPGEPKLAQPESPSLKGDTFPLGVRRGKQQLTKVIVDEALNMRFFLKKKDLLPSFGGELKTDYCGEVPKPTHNISEIAKTQSLAITHFFAADKGPYGCVWQIYIEAEDPDGDMDRICVEVDQVSYGHYPTEWIMIKPQHRKHLRGFLQWNTFSSKASYLPEWTQISVKISIFDHAGNESNKIIIPFTFESGVINRYQLPAPFDKGNIPRIGHIMVDLCYIAI